MMPYCTRMIKMVEDGESRKAGLMRGQLSESYKVLICMRVGAQWGIVHAVIVPGPYGRVTSCKEDSIISAGSFIL